MQSIIPLYSLLLILSFPVFGQQKYSDTNQKPIPTASATENALHKFEQDLKAESLKIYLLGGIVSVIKNEDFEFEKKHNVKYYDFGCTPPVQFKLYERYNELVFDHLIKEYGKIWIAATNQNAFGFQKWKENQ